MTGKRKITKKKVTKKPLTKVFKQDFCQNCVFAVHHSFDADRMVCRRYPDHRRMPVDEWCGEHKRVT